MVDEMGGVDEVDDPAGAVHFRFLDAFLEASLAIPAIPVICSCADGMRPMNIAERPIAAIEGRHRTTGDGVHMVARHVRKGTRLPPHMHQESQLVYAATGTMQVTTPKGRWLVPPDRAVWVPARLGHAIDVLADVQMRTLYFDLAWLKRERQGASLASEFVVRVSPLLH